MSVTYFGYNAIGGSSAQLTITTTYGSKLAAEGIYSFVCPGSGYFMVSELSGYLKYQTTGLGNVRLAIYNLALTTLYAQGAVKVLVNNAAFAWTGHVGVPAIIQYLPLQAGLSYAIALTTDSIDPVLAYDAGSSGDYGSQVNDYTISGFPASLALGTNTANRLSLRCGIDPYAGSAVSQGTTMSLRNFAVNRPLRCRRPSVLKKNR